MNINLKKIFLYTLVAVSLYLLGAYIYSLRITEEAYKLKIARKHVNHLKKPTTKLMDSSYCEKLVEENLKSGKKRNIYTNCSVSKEIKDRTQVYLDSIEVPMLTDTHPLRYDKTFRINHIPSEEISEIQKGHRSWSKMWGEKDYYHLEKPTTVIAYMCSLSNPGNILISISNEGYYSGGSTFQFSFTGLLKYNIKGDRFESILSVKDRGCGIGFGYDKDNNYKVVEMDIDGDNLGEYFVSMPNFFPVILKKMTNTNEYRFFCPEPSEQFNMDDPCP